MAEAGGLVVARPIAEIVRRPAAGHLPVRTGDMPLRVRHGRDACARSHWIDTVRQRVSQDDLGLLEAQRLITRDWYAAC